MDTGELENRTGDSPGVYVGEVEVLALALASPCGVALRVSDFDLCRQRLYKARKGDPDFISLRIRAGTAPDEIWITKEPEAPGKIDLGDL